VIFFSPPSFPLHPQRLIIGHQVCCRRSPPHMSLFSRSLFLPVPMLLVFFRHIGITGHLSRFKRWNWYFFFFFFNFFLCLARHASIPLSSDKDLAVTFKIVLCSLITTFLTRTLVVFETFVPLLRDFFLYAQPSSFPPPPCLQLCWIPRNLFPIFRLSVPELPYHGPFLSVFSDSGVAGRLWQRFTGC